MNKWRKLGAFIVVMLIAAVSVQLYTTISDRHTISQKRASPQGPLPQYVEPLHYDLRLRVNPAEDKFTGFVKIDLDIKKPLREIWLHGQGIDAKYATLKSKQGDIELSYQEMADSGVVRLEAERTVLPQQAELEIEFSAPFDTKLAGLYKVTEKGNPYVFTQFEPIDARKAFPSFDEPRFKVTFDVALEIKQQDKGFANTPQIKEELLPDGFKRLTFARTKPLPTYLVAFAVGDFDVVEYGDIAPSNVREQAIPLRGITTKGKGEQFSYALANTASILATLEEYFGTPYPYEKLDLVAVPDFIAGGMENVGLITYREQLILMGESPSFGQQRNFASIHAHELAHQWFGNLVTMPWWDDLWLNESFATWMANRAMTDWDAKFESSRNMLHWGHGVMSQDSLVNARKVREPIAKNEMIESAFSRITYQKGGAVLSMFERYIGEHVFRLGVQNHMQRFAHGHATAHDFIESMEQVSDKPGLKKAFFSFLTQPGVPTVNLNWTCDEHQVTLSVEQSRYLPLGVGDNKNQVWSLPVCMTLLPSQIDFLAGKPSQDICHMIDKPQQRFIIQSGCPHAVMPNNLGSGYYRFSYGPSQWKNLLDVIDQLNTSEKYSIANNLAAAFRAGDIDANFYVKAAGIFAAQDEWDLISAPMNELKFIGDSMVSSSDKELLASFTEKLYLPVLKRIGLSADSEEDHVKPVATALLRRRVVEFLALRTKEPQLREQLTDMAIEYIGYQGRGHYDGDIKHEALNRDLAATAMSVAVQELGAPFFDALNERIDESSDSAFRQAGLVALGAALDQTLAEQVRSKALGLSLKTNERAYLISSQLRYKQHRHDVYEWMKTYFSPLSKVLPENLVEYTPTIASRFCDVKDADDVEAFFSDHLADNKAAKRNLATTLESIRNCAALKAHQKDVRLQLE